MLAGSSIKFREKSSSTIGRSHWVGRSIRSRPWDCTSVAEAAFRRRRKLRRERSVSFDLQKLRQPRFVDDGLDIGQQSVQAEAQQALAQVLKV